MFDRQAHHHSLESVLKSPSTSWVSDAGLTIEIKPKLGHFNLRGNPADAEFVAAVQAAFNQELPVPANTMTVDPHRIYWLGPTEWLIVTSIDGADDLIAKFSATLDPLAASVTDVSGGQILLQLSGPDVSEILAKGCTLDFHSTKFSPGNCAQSGLAKTNILIGLVDEQPIYEIIVRRSFSEYLVLWLKHAAGEHGVAIIEP